MARISLRAYNADIEAMIDRDQSDEATAHCRYILERFPKHINTYRLMGKSLLEGQRFGDASDVFHRVLSSVPDDFIAHLGMSIIREDEGNIDGAIWHMERSFEVQPSNAAVQVELRRLYSLRDGLTPQKIQLTRGALARMSAKSNLYSQAISELRAALSDDPQRPDLQVVLATMYAVSGSRMEAIETCNTLLSKLPYCYEANRILAEILPETERAEKAQEYKNRLMELDPYYAHLSQVAPTVDRVTDSAVTIERFEYSGEVLDSTTPEQPEWATALGVSIDDEPAPQEETDQWMVTESDEAFPTKEISQEEEIVVESEAAPEEIPADEDDVEQLPDWMNDTEGVEEEDVEGGEAETPEWLRDVMEGPGAEESDAAQAAAAAAVVGQELSEIEQEEAGIPADEDDTLTSETIPSEDFDEEYSTESIPSEAEEHEEVSEAEPPSDGLTPPVETIPGGVAAGAAVTSAALSAAFEDDEGQEIEESAKEIPEEEILKPETAAPDQLDVSIAAEDDLLSEDGESEIPDWLLDLGEGVPEEQEPDLEPETGLAEGLIDEEPDAIQELDEDIDEHTLVDESVEEGVSEVSEFASVPSEDISEAGLTTDEPIAAAEDADFEPGAFEEITPQPEIETEGLEPSVPIESGVQPDEEEFPESLPDWLSAVSPEEESGIIEEGIADSDEEDEIVRAEIPDWLQKMEQQHLAEMAVASMTAEQLEELELEPDFTDLSGEDVPSWLMSAMETELTEEASEISQVEDIEEIFSEPISPEVEQEEAVTEEVLIPESEEGIEEISAEIIDEEISLEPVQAEAIEEKPALELVPEEEDFAEGDTQPVLVEELVETDEPEGEIQLEEIIQPELTEGEITEVEEIQDLEELEEIIPAAEIEADVEPESTVHEDVPELAAEAPLSADDEDAAMAWLESLAARQGAAEEELLTEPAERIEEPPEWIQEEALEEEVEQDEVIDDIAKAAVAGAAIAALTSDDEEQAEPPLTDEEITHEEPPEWVLEIEQELDQALVDAVPEPELEEELTPIEEQAPVDVVPEPKLEEEITPIEEQEPVDAEPQLEFEEELTPIEEQAPVDAVPEPKLEEEITPIEEQVPVDSGPQLEFEEEITPIEEQEIVAAVEDEPPPEEIPDWLTDLAEEEKISPEYQTTDWSPDMLVDEAETDLAAEPDLEAKIDLNAASLSQLEKVPGVGFIHAQNIINHRASSGPYKSLDELEDIPDMTPEVIDLLKAYLTVEVVPEVSPPITTHPDLQNAWNSINSGEIETAVDQYTQMIKQDKHLDEVIRDLQEALGKYPLDVSLYQTLGDAYLHANMLQEALDAYNRAEDLIT